MKKTSEELTNQKEHRETFSGYSVALISSVIKLAHYLREAEEKLQVKR